MTPRLFPSLSADRWTLFADETMTKLYDLAEAADLKGKINAMFRGEAINTTEDRAVLHVATRAPRNKACTEPYVFIHVYP